MSNVSNSRAVVSLRAIHAAVWSVALLLFIAASPDASAQSTTPRFRVAIVGLVHGHSFIEFRNLPNNTAVEVVAISDPDPALRAQAAAIWPGVKIYDDHRKLLDEAKPDGVWSFVDNDQHLAITRDCAERGISVMFEKPMATNYADAVAMRDIAKARGIQIVINSQPPWWPANHTATQLAQSGELGKVWRVHTVSGHGGPGPSNTSRTYNKAFWAMLNDTKRGGGALLDFGPYGAAWVRAYLGMPTSVYAIRTHTREEVYKVPTTTTIIASYPDHRVGLIEASWDLPRNIEQLEVFGDRGSVDLVSNSGGQLLRFEAWQSTEKREVPLVTPEPRWLNAPTYFANALRTRQVDEFLSAGFHADVMAILEAARRSADTGKPVSIKSVMGR
jgi:predicted dehydrogenase